MQGKEKKKKMAVGVKLRATRLEFFFHCDWGKDFSDLN